MNFTFLLHGTTLTQGVTYNIEVLQVKSEKDRQIQVKRSGKCYALESHNGSYCFPFPWPTTASLTSLSGTDQCLRSIDTVLRCEQTVLDVSVYVAFDRLGVCRQVFQLFASTQAGAKPGIGTADLAKLYHIAHRKGRETEQLTL